MEEDMSMKYGWQKLPIFLGESCKVMEKAWEINPNSFISNDSVTLGNSNNLLT